MADSNPFDKQDVEAGAGAGAGAGASGEKPGALSRCCSACSKSVKKMDIKKILWIMRISNLMNVVLFGCAAASGFLSWEGSIVQLFLACYVCFFAFLLCAFELRTNLWSKYFEKLFGFMYSFWGRALFLCFIGSLCLALGHWVTWLVGILTVINACFNCFLICQHPGFKAMGGEQQPSADPGKLDIPAVAAYLKAHPTVAAQAVSNTTFEDRPQPNAPSAPSRSSNSSTTAPPPVPRKSSGARAAPPPAPARSDNPFET